MGNVSFAIIDLSTRITRRCSFHPNQLLVQCSINEIAAICPRLRLLFSTWGKRMFALLLAAMRLHRLRRFTPSWNLQQC
jgi:hypothetical protein